MPWYFNTNPTVIRAKLVDGTSQAFMPRTPIYVPLSNVSAEVVSLVGARALAFRGLDPRDVADQVPLVETTEKIEIKSDLMTVAEPIQDQSTSSSTHESYDNVPQPSEESLGPNEATEVAVPDLDNNEESDGKKRRRRRE